MTSRRRPAGGVGPPPSTVEEALENGGGLPPLQLQGTPQFRPGGERKVQEDVGDWGDAASPPFRPVGGLVPSAAPFAHGTHPHVPADPRTLNGTLGSVSDARIRNLSRSKSRVTATTDAQGTRAGALSKEQWEDEERWELFELFDLDRDNSVSPDDLMSKLAELRRLPKSREDMRKALAVLRGGSFPHFCTLLDSKVLGECLSPIDDVMEAESERRQTEMIFERRAEFALRLELFLRGKGGR